jgi:molybdenum cofactor cytidylyltransferase
MNLADDTKACYGIILLAAGSSQRMGATNKLLAALPSEPSHSLLRSSAKNALVSIERGKLIGHLVVSTGHAHEEVQTEITSLNIDYVFNPEAASGMASSIKVGLTYLQKKAESERQNLDFIIVCLADMPHVQPETIMQLINARLNDKKRCFIIPAYKNQRGNPVLVGHEFFEAMYQLTGDTGARQLIRDNPASIYELSVTDAGVLKDYDKPSDFV